MLTSEWQLKGDGVHVPAMWVWLVRCRHCGDPIRTEPYPRTIPAPQQCLRCRVSWLIGPMFGH